MASKSFCFHPCRAFLTRYHIEPRAYALLLHGLLGICRCSNRRKIGLSGTTSNTWLSPPRRPTPESLLYHPDPSLWPQIRVVLREPCLGPRKIRWLFACDR